MTTKRSFLLLFVAIFFSSQLFAKFGIKAGVNISSEIRSWKDIENISLDNLSGFHVGLIGQIPFSKKASGFGMEIGAFFSQKGSFFSFVEDENLPNTITKAYNELNYAEVPLNLRYTLSLGVVGIYGSAGMYAGYMFNGKTVDETAKEVSKMNFSEFTDKLDYGCTLGVGIEILRKIQIGATWSRGLKINQTPIRINALNEIFDSQNSTFSVGLAYLF